MKLLPYFLLTGLVSLTSCEKADAPTPLLTAAFGQAVTLRCQQGAALPRQSTPELTVTVEDVNDNRCPLGATCFSAGVVVTKLSATDQSGVKQTLTLQLGGINDTAAVMQANGLQYTVVLWEVTPYPAGNDVPKEDKRVVLSVRRP